MPCRTVVLYGDSKFLSTSQFLQCAGRAGRRGFDTQGHVVFCGFDLHRVKTLTLSPPVNLVGRFTLKPTNILQLIQLSMFDLKRAQFALLYVPFFTSKNHH